MLVRLQSLLADLGGEIRGKEIPLLVVLSAIVPPGFDSNAQRSPLEIRQAFHLGIEVGPAPSSRREHAFRA